MRHKIYSERWMERQPYDTATDIDRYYIDIACRVLNVLDGNAYVLSLSDIGKECREDMAMALTRWFQDVVAQGGIWTAFIHECKKRYGSYLPFYPIDEDDYYDNEVNMVDVRFLTWHYVQRMHSKLSVINPENEAISEIANEIYEIFDSEFENAPINDDWHDALHPETFGKSLLFSFREYLYKLIRCDYLCLDVYKSVTDYAEETHSDKSLQDSAKDIMHDYVVSLLFDGEENFMGMSLSEWGREIIRFENEDIAQRLDTIKNIPSRLYLVADEDKKYFHLVDYIDQKAGDATVVYKVRKDSFGLYPSNAYNKGQSIALCRLTCCEGEWYLNGSSVAIPVETSEKTIRNLPTQNLTSNSHSRRQCEKFLEITGGKHVVFPKDKKDAVALYESFAGTGALNKLPATVGDDIVMFASHSCGIGLSAGISHWLKSDDNPRYDEEVAKENAFSIICIPNIPYDVACKMYDMGMIEDAALTSAKGYIHGRNLLQHNAQFLMDYFLCGKRE